MLHSVPPPVVRQQDGRLSIRVPLRHGADLAAVLVELISSISEQAGAAGAPVNMKDGAAVLKV